MNEFTLLDVNARLTQAQKKLRELGLPKLDLTLIVGKREVKDLKRMIWIGGKRHENGMTKLQDLGFPIIECNMDSVFEICWVIPRTVR